MNLSTITTGLNPYMLWIKLGAVLLIVSGIFGVGAYTAHRFDAATIQAMKTDAAKLLAQQAQQDNAALAKSMQDAYGQAVKDNALNAASAARQVQIQTVYRTITKEVHDAKITECSNVGPDFVRIYNAAVAGVRARSAPSTPAAGHATGP